jgi:hypothetical protein
MCRAKFGYTDAEGVGDSLRDPIIVRRMILNWILNNYFI